MKSLEVLGCFKGILRQVQGRSLVVFRYFLVFMGTVAAYFGEGRCSRRATAENSFPHWPGLLPPRCNLLPHFQVPALFPPSSQPHLEAKRSNHTPITLLARYITLSAKSASSKPHCERSPREFDCHTRHDLTQPRIPTIDQSTTDTHLPELHPRKNFNSHNLDRFRGCSSHG